MKRLFKWSRRKREPEPLAPLTRREKAKAAVHGVAADPPTGDRENHMLGILMDYASDKPIPLIASRRHCSETTVNRRINEALQRWHKEPE